LDIQFRYNEQIVAGLYHKIAEQIKLQILTRELAPGQKLPSIRSQARELGVSNLTVVRAYEVLKDAQLVVAHPRSGVRVADPVPRTMGAAIVAQLPDKGPMAAFEQISRSAHVLSLASSVGDPSLLHADEFMAELQCMQADPWAFYYPDAAGDASLVRQISKRLARTDIVCDEGSLVVTNGGLGASMALLDVLCKPGDTVLVQEPGRVWLDELLRARNVVGVPVKLSDEGIDLDHLEYCAERFEPKAMLVSPDFGHCTGVKMTLANRLACVDVAQRGGMMLIEDGSYSDIHFGSQPLPSLMSVCRHGVALVGSFSYCLAPGLRLGYCVVPPSIRAQVVQGAEALAISGPPIIQLALAAFMDRGLLDLHLKRVLPRYQLRRNALESALKSHAPDSVHFTRPEGGFSSWLTLPPGFNSSALYSKALKAGVAFAPGRLFLTAGDPGRHLRLSYGMLEPDAITDAVRTLARLLPR
jgi:DNA-binding transcriptional MocR family regulator